MAGAPSFCVWDEVTFVISFDRPVKHSGHVLYQSRQSSSVWPPLLSIPFSPIPAFHRHFESVAPGRDTDATLRNEPVVFPRKREETWGYCRECRRGRGP